MPATSEEFEDWEVMAVEAAIEAQISIPLPRDEEKVQELHKIVARRQESTPTRNRNYLILDKLLRRYPPDETSQIPTRGPFSMAEMSDRQPELWKSMLSGLICNDLLPGEAASSYEHEGAGAFSDMCMAKMLEQEEDVQRGTERRIVTREEFISAQTNFYEQMKKMFLNKQDEVTTIPVSLLQDVEKELAILQQRDAEEDLFHEESSPTIAAPPPPPEPDEESRKIVPCAGHYVEGLPPPIVRLDPDWKGLGHPGLRK